jgi:HD-GYP domain-containing protein (c-di-GMP phosphodiesterase class II)
MMHVAIKQYMQRTGVYVAELQRLNYRLTDSYEATLHALTRALDTRDEETEEHSQRVKRYTQLIVQRLRLPMDEQETIICGALLHDIGKIGVPDAILLKTAPLTDNERAQVRNHPEIGYTMIAHIPFLAQAAQVVLHHHEAYDGSGYPYGLSGEHIPLGARIFAVADTYDAMTSDRPYRRALPHSVACAELARCRGTQFDPLVVDTFLSIAEAELQVVQQEVAVFVKQSRVASGANYSYTNERVYAVNNDGEHSSGGWNTGTPSPSVPLKTHYQQS